jgi:hypothetical protein
VEGHVPTALYFEYLNPSPLQLWSGKRQALRPGTPPQGHHGVVLHQEEEVFTDLTGDALPA